MSNRDENEALLPPDTLVDHFQVVRQLGAGGMGEVYLARDTKLGRRVALKVIHAERMGSDEAVKGFWAEAQITARFSHPHIVAIFFVGEHNGNPYLALEYLEGQTLSERLRTERPGVHESIRISLAIAEALAEAHGGGVLHRDLKPSNVLIPKDGRIRVLDFGISKVQSNPDALPDAQETVASNDEASKVAGEDTSSQDEVATVTVATQVVAPGLLESGDPRAPRRPMRQTTSGRVVGTPSYLSPERWQGKKGTEAADIWALGLVMYQLVSGHHPYQGSSEKQLRARITSGDPVPAIDPRVELPPELQTLIMRSLDKDPRARPTAPEIISELRELLSRRRSPHHTDASPFRGLRAFQERHANQFFGREAEVLAFVERLRETPVLPVVGASGAGKSSFVQAGIIPRLREQGPWLVLRLRPGASPFETLAKVLTTEETSSRSLRRIETDTTATVDSGKHQGINSAEPIGEGQPARIGGDQERLSTLLAESPSTLSLALHQLAKQTASKLLLFVDQAEELYTLTEAPEVRYQFMQAICTAADDPLGPVRVIFTMRQDFLSRLAESDEAQAALSHVTVMRKPRVESLRDILVKPLEGTGHKYENSQLVADLVGEVQHEPACLPLLAFAAQTLWERRDKERRLLLRSSYESMGDVGGALAEHGDGVLSGMSPTQVQLARQILLRLVTSEGTRRVTTRKQVLEGLGQEAREVLNRLTGARLISARKGRGADWESAQLELVHEALIQRWTQLSHWLDESREDLVFLSEVGGRGPLGEARSTRNRGLAWRCAD